MSTGICPTPSSEKLAALLSVSVMKKAYMDRNQQIQATVIANSGLLVSILAGAMAAHAMKKAPKASGREAGSLVRTSELPDDYPRGLMPKLGNAMYIPGPPKHLTKSSAWTSMKTYPTDRTRFDENVKRDKGVLLFDPDYHAPAIVGHEIGHAEIAQKGGLGNFNQKYLRPVGGLLSLAALVSASRAATLSIRQRQAIAASAVLGVLPTLINEAQASSISKRLMDKAGYSKSEQAPQRKALRNAYMTYLAGGLAPAASLIAALEYLDRA